ncbi:MAG TPA: secretin N-terminal domain-containing protein [Thermoanaerobaculia bacterium]|nr:secretin N-terminal domain-containing protein [Thermoanaerobaculia bacterium]
MLTRFWKLAGVLAFVVAAAGCAGIKNYEQAKDEEQVGHYDLAVMEYAKALELDPTSAQYKAALARARVKASQFHFEKGKMYRNSGRFDLSVVELEQSVALDPTNDYAATELKHAREDLAKSEQERSTESRMESLKKKVKGARATAIILEPSSDRPINLNFPQPKPIKQIYRALADAAGINVIFDPQLKDDNVSIVLSNIEFQKALETLLRQENHFYKIIDERTILIAADTPQNRKTYEDLVIRTFFLSNADVTEVANALRALLQTTRISVNKAENSVTLRDTADKVAVAERIVAMNDKQVSEVVIDVELLQINSDKLLDLGLTLNPRIITASVPAPTNLVNNLGAQIPSGQFNWQTLKQININSFGFTIPSAQLNFIKDNTDAELLAKPQLRIAEGQKAQLLIGDKVPIPVTSFNSSNLNGSTIVPVTSYQYQDVGIKIEVEPRVHHNKEVTLKLMTEVSNINGYVGAAPNQQPIIGTRTISSNIRLKDGETNFLAGLYRTDKAMTKNLIPFLSDIPVVGLLFTHDNTDKKVTDLVLTLTPHIIRIPDVTEEDVTPYYVGTDANISYQGGPRVENPTRDQGPFEQQPPGATRQPPPGAQVKPGQPVGNPAINLAPAGGPSDIFKPPPTPPPPTGAPNPPQPQGAVISTDPTSVAVAAKSATADSSTDASQVLFDFDPAYLSVAPGAQQTILVRATSAGGLPGGSVSIRFDSSTVAVLGVRPILGSDSGMAEGHVDNGHAVITFPAIDSLGGTRALAEITLRGVAPGRSALAFEPVNLGGAAVTPSQAVVDVK